MSGTEPATQGRPRLLDLFCGAGGAALGYQRAGFHVTGVDHRQQPRYAGDTFVLADAFDTLRDPDTLKFGDFDAVHAAPLWHRWTRLAEGRNGTAENHPDQIGDTQALLETVGLPYVLELGTTSPQEGVTICGVSCGLRVTRHMRFATNWLLMVPPCSHRHGGAANGDYVPFRGSYHKERPTWRKAPHDRKGWREAADVAWMSCSEADLASPPVYTELIGHQLMQHLQARAA